MVNIDYLLSQVRLTVPADKALSVLRVRGGLNRARHECTNYEFLLDSYCYYLTHEQRRILKNHVNDILCDLWRQEMSRIAKQQAELLKQQNSLQQSCQDYQSELEKLRLKMEEDRRGFTSLIKQVQQEAEEKLDEVTLENEEIKRQSVEVRALHITRLFNDAQQRVIDELLSVCEHQNPNYVKTLNREIGAEMHKIDREIEEQLRCKTQALRNIENQVFAWRAERDKVQKRLIELELSLEKNAGFWQHDSFIKELYFQEKREYTGLQSRFNYIKQQIRQIIDHPVPVLSVLQRINNLKAERQGLDLRKAKIAQEVRQITEVKRRDVAATLRELEVIIRDEPTLNLRIDQTVFDLLRDAGISYS
jgi:hypothetical protein